MKVRQWALICKRFRELCFRQSHKRVTKFCFLSNRQPNYYSQLMIKQSARSSTCGPNLTGFAKFHTSAELLKGPELTKQLLPDIAIDCNTLCIL